ncbi:hypothetical protein VNI00_002793 [Paramarasmius palmivorus]|uniref:NmrA-like domain-containing protein n=1 Tax=Paramarasmius palmivorus TaxID=297713 RepID=A0AAW0DX84_9AGAR
MARSQRICVPGGTGGVGRYVVDALLAVQPKYNLYIIVLSRSPSPPITVPNSAASAEVIQVDYSDPAQLESIIRTHQIDTIISNLINWDLSKFSEGQEALLRAALKVPTFRRFAPSEFSVDSESLDPEYNYYACKLPLLHTLRQLKVEHPHLEWTKFVCGVFHNYFAFGCGKEDEAMKYLRRHPVRIDGSTLKADIPGDGERKVSFTAAEDMGRFVAEATQLEEWPEKLDMAGDIKSYNEIVKIFEDVTGKKLQVRYKTEDDVLSLLKLPPQGFSHGFHMADMNVIRGRVEQGRTLNEMFPGVKPIGIKDFVEKWWCQKENDH